MIDVTPTLFAGERDDAREARIKAPGISTIALTWTPTPSEALAVIRGGGNALLPRDDWQVNAAVVLAALGCTKPWIARCIAMADYRDEGGDPMEAFHPR